MMSVLAFPVDDIRAHFRRRTKVFDDEQAKKDLPCAKVKPVSPGRVFWFTDAAATFVLPSRPWVHSTLDAAGI
jgi:hypothetical protein